MGLTSVLEHAHLISPDSQPGLAKGPWEQNRRDDMDILTSAGVSSVNLLPWGTGGEYIRLTPFWNNLRLLLQLFPNAYHWCWAYFPPPPRDTLWDPAARYKSDFLDQDFLNSPIIILRHLINSQVLFKTAAIYDCHILRVLRFSECFKNLRWFGSLCWTK